MLRHVVAVCKDDDMGVRKRGHGAPCDAVNIK